MSVPNNKDGDPPRGVEDIIGKLTAAAIKTPAFNRAARSIVSAALRNWSDGKYLRGKLAGLAERFIKKLLPEQAGAVVSADELIRSIDVGELKEAADGLEDSLPALIRAVNDKLWNYPAKP